MSGIGHQIIIFLKEFFVGKYSLFVTFPVDLKLASKSGFFHNNIAYF